MYITVLCFPYSERSNFPLNWHSRGAHPAPSSIPPTLFTNRQTTSPRHPTLPCSCDQKEREREKRKALKRGIPGTHRPIPMLRRQTAHVSPAHHPSLHHLQKERTSIHQPLYGLAPTSPPQHKIPHSKNRTMGTSTDRVGQENPPATR